MFVCVFMCVFVGVWGGGWMCGCVGVCGCGCVWVGEGCVCVGVCIYICMYIYGSGSSVRIATDYRLVGPGSNTGADDIFRPSIPAVGPTQPPVKWVPGLSRG